MQAVAVEGDEGVAGVEGGFADAEGAEGGVD